MKKSLKNILIFIFLLTANKGIAQINYEYDTCNLDIYRQFEGEWRYTNGIDTIRFYLKAHRIYSPQGDFGRIFVYDRLVGWHEYKRGNTVIESNYNNRFMTLPSNIYLLPDLTISISLTIDENYGVSSMNSRRFLGHIDDFGLNGELIKVGKAIFDSNIQTLQWTQWRSDFSRNPETAVMTLPGSFTLIKQ